MFSNIKTHVITEDVILGCFDVDSKFLDGDNVALRLGDKSVETFLNGPAILWLQTISTA